MNRREFLVRIGGALVAVPVVLQVVSCGSSDPGAPRHVDEFSSTSAGSPFDGHTHVAVLACTAVAGGLQVTIASSTTGTHHHDVVLTPTHLATIASGGTANTTSTTVDGHAHAWAFHKPSNAC